MSDQPAEEQDPAPKSGPTARRSGSRAGRWLYAIAAAASVALLAQTTLAAQTGTYAAPDPAALLDLTTRDSDGDGIPDVVEIKGWATSRGVVHHTDPRNADTDGDGLSDAEEAGKLLDDSGEQHVYEGLTDPTRRDSDGDGLDDWTETRGWRTAAGAFHITDPVDRDTDGDGLSDGEEAGNLVNNTVTPHIYRGISDPTNPDSDGDGFGDREEVMGWRTQDGSIYRTDPMLADSDGDGLWDSHEAGLQLPIGKYEGLSDPLLVDTDADGLTDGEEFDFDLDPRNPDTDGDGLSDYEEIELATSPHDPDTDGDGFDDAYEVNNPELGLDPRVADEQIDKWDYAASFAKGAVAGELWPEDSTAWLAGNLVAGGASFIPGVGVIVGTVADVRDTVGAAIRWDWVTAGFVAVGLVPYVGDAAAVPGKIARFVARAPHLRVRTAALIASIDNLPQGTRVAAFRSIWKQWDKLRAEGFSEGSLVRLQAKNVDLDHLADVMSRPGHLSGPSTPFITPWRNGEVFLEEHYRKTAADVTPQKFLRTDGCVEVCNVSNTRRVDVFVDGVARESKVGKVSWSQRIEKEIQADAHLVKTGEVDSAHWHFFASDKGGGIGPVPKVVDLLDAHGITYTIHPPR